MYEEFDLNNLPNFTNMQCSVCMFEKVQLKIETDIIKGDVIHASVVCLKCGTENIVFEE